MTPKEAHARSEIDRIALIPLRQRTEEDRRAWEIALLQRDFCVNETERQKVDAEIKADWKRMLGK